MDLNALVDRYRDAIRPRDSRGNAFGLANALRFNYNSRGLIARMINWYGQAV